MQHRDMLKILQSVFSEKIPFNRVLGLRVTGIDDERVTIEFPMRDELIGNYVRGALHGGVISAVLDVCGGLVSYVGVLRHMDEASFEEKMERFTRLGTIDLRVDYLRPGIGGEFHATGFVLRTGSRVAVTRMELTSGTGVLIAVGTGTYIVS